MELWTDPSVKSLLQRWKKNPGLLWAFSILWIIFISWLAFGWNLGGIGLIDETEPLFAEAARLMTVTGDWITPYFNGEPRFDKPPLVYWLMAIAYQTIGVNEWAVRLPSVLAAFALTVFGFLTLRYFGLPHSLFSSQNSIPHSPLPIPYSLWFSAWIGSALIALNPQTIVWARIGVSDMLLSGCIGSALLAFFWGYVQPVGSKLKPWWYLAFWFFCALAVLTKGPVGIVLPGAIIATFLLYLGKAKEVLKEMQPIKGILIFLLLALPWYIFVTLINGQTYIDSFFGYHNVERFTRAVNNHAAPWYFYFPIVLLGFAPWSFYLPVAIARLRFWQVTRWQQQPRLDHLGLFALVWFTVIFGFFTVAATKLPSYLLPLMPAAAILVGLLWSEQMTEPRSPRSVQISSILSLIFAGILAGVLPYSPNWIGGDPSMPNLPQVIRESSIVIRGAGIWLAVVIVGSIVLLRRQGRWIWMIHLVGFVAFLLFTVMPAVSLVDSERQLPLRQLAITIVQNQRPGEEIIMFGMKKPSLSFYTQQPITYISRINQATQYLQRKTRRSPRPQSVLVIGYPRKLQQLGLKPRRYQVIQRMGGYELIRVKPRRRVI